MALFKRQGVPRDPYTEPDPEVPDTRLPGIGHTDREMLMLKEMKDAGIDLERPRLTHFYIVFTSEKDSDTAGLALEIQGFEVNVRPADEKLPIWGLLASRRDRGLVPLLAEVSNLLYDVAEQNQGTYDGWECALDDFGPDASATFRVNHGKKWDKSSRG